MCLILLAYRSHPDYPLIVAANRDEFLDRPTEPARFWKDHPDLLAGRDGVGGGTWMGITRRGRFAALTNFRNPSESLTHKKKSRGLLVRDYLITDLSPQNYLKRLSDQRTSYPGFNLLVGSHRELWYYSNQTGAVCSVAPGIHGLSNALLDTPWPKVVKGKARMAACLQKPDPSCLFELLADEEPAPDEQLPDTGIGLERERLLSPAFIRAPGYGTRSSTVLLVSARGEVNFIERSFAGEKTTEVRYRFFIEEE
ncbi:MAG: NRDE family protein [Planifilum sp.]|jgi:uncharacterized protein with NRDE domain